VQVHRPPTGIDVGGQLSGDPVVVRVEVVEAADVVVGIVVRGYSVVALVLNSNNYKSIIR